MTDIEEDAVRWRLFRNAIANEDHDFIEAMEIYFVDRGIDKPTEQDIDNAIDHAGGNK